MNKFILIFLYALVLSFSFQYFFPPKTPLDTTVSNILVSIADDSIVVPNIPKLTGLNQTASGWNFSPCKDLKITIDSQPVIGISTEFPDFCREVYIAPGASEALNLEALAPIFASRDGKYAFIIITPLGERITTLSVDRPGAFRSFLTTVVYEPIYNLFVALLIFLPGHSLGWAILIITLIVRLILLVPQHHMLQSQKKTPNDTTKNQSTAVSI